MFSSNQHSSLCQPTMKTSVLQHYWEVPTKSRDRLHSKTQLFMTVIAEDFQVKPFKSRRFPGFPGVISNFNRFPEVSRVIDIVWSYKLPVIILLNNQEDWDIRRGLKVSSTISSVAVMSISHKVWLKTRKTQKSRIWVKITWGSNLIFWVSYHLLVQRYVALIEGICSKSIKLFDYILCMRPVTDPENV